MRQDWQSKYLTILIVLIAFIDGMLVAGQFQDKNTSPAVGLVLEDSLEQKNSSDVESNVEEEVVPFVSQAPLGTWNDPWAYFAEEANAYMANLWSAGAELPSREELAAALLAARDWETTNLGTYKDTDLTQTYRLLTEYYKLSVQLNSEVSREALLAELDTGKILIVPLLNLENPHYVKPGPEHHMLLIYGYEGEKFLSNDPGTSRGEAYAYDIQEILDHLQDLDGEARVLVISR